MRDLALSFTRMNDLNLNNYEDEIITFKVSLKEIYESTKNEFKAMELLLRRKRINLQKSMLF